MPRTRREIPGVVRFAVVVLCLCAIITGGCKADEQDRSQGKQTTTTIEPSQSSTLEKAAKTARIVCGPEGTRVLTPRVGAHTDGVHFVVDNQYKKGTSYSFEYAEGGGEGDSAPRGESEHIGEFPPGKIRIGCEKPPVDGTGQDYENLEVVDPDGVYKPAEIECKGDTAVSGMAEYAYGVKGKKGDPVEIARREFSRHIRDGDEVELAGYPQSREHRTVRVVRDGLVMAKIVYFREGKGWLQDHYEACGSF